MNTKQLLLALASTLLPIMASAYGTKVGELYYTFDENSKTARVVNGSGDFGDSISVVSYSGDIVIPETVTFNSQTYTVTSIEGGHKDSGYTPYFACSFEDSKITSIVIPKTIKTIEDYTFRGCRNLKTITFEGSVESIGNCAFESFVQIVKIVVTDNASFCESKFPELLNSNLRNSLIQLINKEGNEITEFVVPEGVTAIANSVFSNCRNLTSVTIPNSVTSIGDSAFSGCRSLTSITIPYSVTSIGDSAFSGCGSLTSVTIPNSVTNIGIFAFDGCRSLTSVTIGSGVKNIGEDAFQECTSLNDITFHCKKIGEWIRGLKFVKEVVIGNEVTSIEAGAFQDCTGMNSVTIVSSEASIAEGAFDGCDNITAVHISDLAAWCKLSFGDAYSNPLCFAQHLFIGGKEITDLVIPSSVTEIKQYAFVHCNSLATVIIPNSVKSIGEYAFEGCEALATITIPNSVNTIGEAAFESCIGLNSVIFEEGVANLGKYAFYACYNLKDVFCNCKTAPSCGDKAFCQDDVKNATLHVKDYAVESYMGKEPWTYFKEIVYGEPVTEFNLTYYLDNQVYKQYKHKYLDPVTPEPDPEKEQFTFSGWSEIPENMPAHDVNVYGTFSSTEVILDGITYQIKDNVATPIKNTKTGDVTIQPYIEDRGKQYPVKTIPSSVFANNINITSLVIPDSVEAIQTRAFSGCRNLVKITLPSTLKTVGERAFANIDKLNEVICYAKDVPTADRTTFENSYTNYATLQVPQHSVNTYKTTAPWSGFMQILSIPGSDTPAESKCATPSIVVYYGSKIILSCNTPDVTFHYDITRSGTINPDQELPLTATYTLTVYASRQGYEDSDTNKIEIPLNGGTVGDANNDGTVDVADIANIIDIMSKQ